MLPDYLATKWGRLTAFFLLYVTEGLPHGFATIALAAELRERGGSLQVANPNPLCGEVLRFTRIDETIPVQEDLESAGRSFL